MRRKVLLSLLFMAAICFTFSGGFMKSMNVYAQVTDTQSFSEVQEDGLSYGSTQAPLVQEGIYPEENTTGKRVYYRSEQWNNAVAAVSDGLRNVQTSINISEYGINKSYVAMIYAEAINNNPDLFYVSSTLNYSFNSSNNTIYAFKPEYIASADQINTMKTAFNNKVTEFKKNIDATLSDAEIALQVHDNLATSVNYDYENYNNGTIPTVSHTAYGAMVNDVSVCDGYALAYSYIMNQCYGISTMIVTSDSMGHAWNMVKIDGSYYHVDVTFDDPVVNKGFQEYYVLHDYFLVSDAIQNHSGWNSTDIVCANTKYDNAAWRYYGSNETAADGIMGYADGYWYFVNDKDYYVYKYSFNTNSSTKTNIEIAGGEVIPGDGVLYYYEYYNRKQLHSMNMDGSNDKLCYTASNSENDYFTNLKFINNILYYSYGENTYCTNITRTAIGPVDIPLQSIALSQTSTKIEADDSFNLSVTYNPTNTTVDRSVIWTSSNTNVATVDSKGNVTGINGGSATITATVNGVSAQCSVTVRAKGITVYNGVDYASVYDKNYYFDNNQDVATAFGDDPNMLLWHFVNYGMAEGRCAKDSFNVVKYMYAVTNDDLRAVYGGNMVQYYTHYIFNGRFEGRSVSSFDGIFDAQYYLTNNPDVYQNIVSRYTSDGNLYGWALWHYYEYGMNEGRRGSATFGVFNYLAANADIYKVYGRNLRAANIHYLQYGINEGRSITPKYDMYTLSTTRPDVAAAFGNNIFSELEWYINYGSKDM